MVTWYILLYLHESCSKHKLPGIHSAIWQICHTLVQNPWALKQLFVHLNVDKWIAVNVKSQKFFITLQITTLSHYVLTVCVLRTVKVEGEKQVWLCILQYYAIFALHTLNSTHSCMAIRKIHYAEPVAYAHQSNQNSQM